MRSDPDTLQFHSSLFRIHAQCTSFRSVLPELFYWKRNLAWSSILNVIVLLKKSNSRYSRLIRTGILRYIKMPQKFWLRHSCGSITRTIHVPQLSHGSYLHRVHSVQSGLIFALRWCNTPTRQNFSIPCLQRFHFQIPWKNHICAAVLRQFM